MYPNSEYISHDTFRQALNTVESMKADYAVIPIENSNAGRVQDTYTLLLDTKLYIIEEYYLKIEHQLLGLKGSKLNDIKIALSHQQALSQCSKFLSDNTIKAQPSLNTAIACQEIIKLNDKSKGAIASKLAGQIYGLDIIAENIQNDQNNTTRFIILSKNKSFPEYIEGYNYITSLMTEISDNSLSFYEMLQPLYENNINVRKIESYSTNKNFKSNKFYIEIESHIFTDTFKKAYEKIVKVVKEIRIIGVYKSSS